MQKRIIKPRFKFRHFRNSNCNSQKKKLTIGDISIIYKESGSMLKKLFCIESANKFHEELRKRQKKTKKLK